MLQTDHLSFSFRRVRHFATQNNFPEHDRVVVNLVMCGIDQRDGALACQRPQLPQQFGVLMQLGTITVAELFPAARPYCWAQLARLGRLRMNVAAIAMQIAWTVRMIPGNPVATVRPSAPDIMTRARPL